LALDGVGGQRHAPAALPPGKVRYPSYSKLGGTQGRSGRVREILRDGQVEIKFHFCKDISVRTQMYSGYPLLGHNNFRR